MTEANQTASQTEKKPRKKRAASQFIAMHKCLPDKSRAPEYPEQFTIEAEGASMKAVMTTLKANGVTGIFTIACIHRRIEISTVSIPVTTITTAKS